MTNADTSTNAQPSSPVIKKPSRFNLIWLLPIAALIICIGLALHSYKNEGLETTLQFSNAQGIIAGKTHVVYNGITVGQVKSIRATSDLKNVDVTLSIDDKFKPWLTDKTEFWLVKPNVSLSGVTGLETLVSGNYIAMKPNNEGQPASHFTALKKPPSEDNLPGLHITLITDKLHSISIGSPVYFNQIEVGKVTDYSLQSKTHDIIIKLVIQPEYEDLVHHNSRFWSASGFDLSATLKGLKVHAESLTTLLKGGIAFYTPIWEPTSPPASNGDQFIMHNNFEDAQPGIPVNIRFPLLHSAIKKGTPIIFHGIEVGTVRTVKINSDLEHFTAEAIINPSAKNLLIKDAHFWMIRPQVSLSGISDITTLVNGPYIAIDASKEAIKKGIPKTQFEGYENRNYAPLNMPGLNITLKATALNGIHIKSPVFYKDMQIGRVEHTHLGNKGQYVYININIFPEYQHLVNHSSQFKNISNISVNASLTGIKVKIGPLESIISGGINVVTATIHAAPIKQGSELKLQLSDQEKASGLTLSLVTPNLGSIKEGIPVLYLGVPVGKVTGYRLDNPANHVIIEIVISPPYTRLVTSKSQFWNISGLKVDAGLFSGVHINAQSLQTIALGGIAFATPNASDTPIKSQQRFILHAKENPQWKTWKPSISTKLK